MLLLFSPNLILQKKNVEKLIKYSKNQIMFFNLIVFSFNYF